MYDFLTEKLFANQKAIRRIPNQEKIVYLTFDDGPDGEFTPQVLQVLKDCDARATFFVIADKAEKHKPLLQSIIAHGHRLGNHSPDHAYGVLFSDSEVLRQWVQRGEDLIFALTGQSSVGFRPPNGVITPHLIKALDGLNQPLVLWNCRFFDTLTQWRQGSALRALRKIKSGDIILLHDTQKEKRRPVFLYTLRKFLREGQALGWRFEPLPEKIKGRSQ